MTRRAVCYNVQERLVPYLRASASRRLAATGLTQGRIAAHLGVSQAMVSRYLKGPAGAEPGIPLDMARRLVEATVQGALAEEAEGSVGTHCPACVALSDHGFVAAWAPLVETDQCRRGDAATSLRDHEQVVAALTAAAARFQGADLRPLQPAVRINLAMRLPSASDARDVAAFPGRLVQLGDSVRPVAAPAFGSSSHLSEALLSVARHRTDLRAVMNVRWDDDVERACRAKHLDVRILGRSGGHLDFKPPAQGAIAALADPGDFGVEPSLYILGATAARVVDVALALLSSMRPAQHQEPLP